MAYPTPQVTKTTGAVFIPEIWSDEVIAAYKQNLVMANLVSKMSFKGKKGDTLHIPKPTRGAASAKAASTAVTLIAANTLNTHVSLKTLLKFKPCHLCAVSTLLTLATLWASKLIPLSSN
jgi:hypothetical protein